MQKDIDNGISAKEGLVKDSVKRERKEGYGCFLLYNMLQVKIKLYNSIYIRFRCNNSLHFSSSIEIRNSSQNNKPTNKHH